MQKRDFRDFSTFLFFVLPGFIVYILVVAYPIVYSVFLSFSDYNPNTAKTAGWNLVGLSNYTRMFQDSSFWYAFKNNMIVVAISIFGQIPIGFILAFILFRKQIKASSFFQSMVFLPQFLSTIVIGIMWRLIFAVDGPVSRLMQMFSGDPNRQFMMMHQRETAMIPIAIALIWMYTGFYMIIFLANLQKIDDSMVEAAKIDGANEIQVFTKLIVPLLAGTILVSCILAIAGSLKGFALIFSITSEGITRTNVEVLPIFMYRMAFQNPSNPLRFAYGAAISNVIVVISIVMILVSRWIGKKLGTDEEY